MATAAQLVPDEPQTAGTDIVVAVTQNPGIVLLDTQKFDAFYDKLKAKAPADADVTTRKGREALRSFASDVRSEKAAIDKARLRLTKEWRDMTAQANAAGKVIEERLESLAVEVRQPLTQWEAAEKARVEKCRSIIDNDINGAAVVTLQDTAAAVRQRGSDVWNIVLDPDKFGDMLPEAQAAKDAAVATLQAAFARLEREEADRAELERLRAEAAEREEADRLKREEAERVAAAQEAARREAEELKAYEERRAAAEKAALEELAREKERAAEQARRDAEAAAEAERARIQREHEAALAAERDRAAAAERAAQAERDRIAAEERVRAVEVERVAAEQAAREADQAHRTAVKTAAKEAIMTCGADEETARKIVTLIIAKEVPNVRLEF